MVRPGAIVRPGAGADNARRYLEGLTPCRTKARRGLRRRRAPPLAGRTDGCRDQGRRVRHRARGPRRRGRPGADDRLPTGRIGEGEARGEGDSPVRLSAHRKALADGGIGHGLLLQDRSRPRRPGVPGGVEGDGVVVSGGSDVGVLYGAYRYAELLGVRFYLHGDVVPDERLTDAAGRGGNGQAAVRAARRESVGVASVRLRCVERGRLQGGLHATREDADELPRHPLLPGRPSLRRADRLAWADRRLRCPRAGTVSYPSRYFNTLLTPRGATTAQRRPATTASAARCCSRTTPGRRTCCAAIVPLPADAEDCNDGVQPHGGAVPGRLLASPGDWA